MDYIERPKEVTKGQRNYLTERNYQDYVNAQFNIIYDKIDEIIKYINQN